MSKICPNCKRELNDTAKFCTGCGMNVESVQPAIAEVQTEAKCPHCGASINPGKIGNFCVLCGGSLVELREAFSAQSSSRVMGTDSIMQSSDMSPNFGSDSSIGGVDHSEQQDESTVILDQSNNNPSDENATVILPESSMNSNSDTMSFPFSHEMDAPLSTNPFGEQHNSIYDAINGGNMNNKGAENNIFAQYREEKAEKNQNKPKKKSSEKKVNPLFIIIPVAVVLIFVVAGVCLKVFVFDKKSASDLSASSASEETVVVEEKEDDKPRENQGALSSKTDKIVDEYAEKVFDDDLRSTAMEKLAAAIDSYTKTGAVDDEDVASGLKRAFTAYDKGTVKQVNMLFELEPSSDIYQEILNNIEDTVALAESVSEKGFHVEIPETLRLKDNIEENYRGKYIDKFNGFIDEYNWNVRSNEEYMSGAKDVFEMQGEDDPLLLRYKYAYAWLVHQEISEKLEAGIYDFEDAYKAICEAAEDTDYCEFLMEEAESYAMQADANQSYFDRVSSEVLDNSSSHEYSYDELDSMNLSPAELRLARMEIYGRHGMITWDENINQAFRKRGDISMYKFMSYNDFGMYSTDNTNGLTTTERHNIRTFAKYEIEHAKDGYFALNN